MRLGALEAGGTKMVCAVVDEKGTVIDREVFPTGIPADTMPKMIDYFTNKEIDALGIASFGPVDLNKQSPTYGYIMNTPKKGWNHYDILGEFKRRLCVPTGFDTDVNGAMLGELRMGAAVNKNSAIYITIGTGVGVGVYLNGGLLHGLTHPEAGHILLNRHSKDSFLGVCPFHKNCLEGLASGPAIENRWGKNGAELSECAQVWELESYYIASAIVNYILTYSPEIIILGGGVMHQAGLIERIRKDVISLLGGYVASPMLSEKIDEYIVTPKLADNAGIVGAAMLGLENLGF